MTADENNEDIRAHQRELQFKSKNTSRAHMSSLLDMVSVLHPYRASCSILYSNHLDEPMKY